VLQFVEDVKRFVSQPVDLMPSQSSKFVLQELMPHAPERHATVAFASAPQGEHDPPQLFTEVLLSQTPLQE